LEQLPVPHSLPAEQLWPVFLLQAPAASQVFAPVQVSASSALVTLAHVPAGAPLQRMHVPVQSDAQQTPSLQIPDAHESEPSGQSMPFASGSLEYVKTAPAVDPRSSSA
jgi:hypothetical protein